MTNAIEDMIKNLYVQDNQLHYKFFNNKKILMTGASGLIGLNFTYFLLGLINKGYSLKGIDLVTRSGIDRHFNEIHKSNLIRVFKLDLNVSGSIDELKSYDVIIHAAGYAQPNKFLKEKISTISLNTTVTMILLKKLKSNGHFLYLSSSEVYTGSKSNLYSEDEIGYSNTNHPRSSYIEAKRCGEAICYAHASIKANVRIARVSLLYGPGVKYSDERVMSELIKKGIDGDVNILDSGDAIRSYCFITDGIYQLVNILCKGNKAIYNVGGESEVSILDLANLISSNLNRKVCKGPDKASSAPLYVKMDLTRIKELYPLKFTDFKIGLELTVNWFRELLIANT
jgi:UDP-glucuronate decarboxylase